MPLGTIPLPYGLRDLKVRPIAADGTVGTAVDLPNAQTFSFQETEDETELRGDDKVVASHGSGPTVDWTLEAGGISLEAYKIIAGGTLATAGTTPSQIKTYGKKTTDNRPYFQVEGQSISDSGGDVHGIVYRCKAGGNIGGSFADGAFFVTSCSGKGYGNETTDKLYDFVQNETAAAIV